jgi:hypothetical protein
LGKNSTCAKLTVVALLAPLVLAAPAAAFDCPASQPTSHPGVIKETPEQMAAFVAGFGQGGLDGNISNAIAKLRERYPGAESAELVNYLVTAYCPVVEKLPILTDTDKTGRMRVFAAQVMQRLY